MPPVEDQPESGAYEGLVVGEHDARAARFTVLQGDQGPHTVAAERAGAGAQGAAVDGEAFAQADQSAAVAGGRGGPGCRRCR
jgi:hypothetical protein